jgi:hypothetical protein
MPQAPVGMAAALWQCYCQTFTPLDSFAALEGHECDNSNTHHSHGNKAIVVFDVEGKV